MVKAALKVLKWHGITAQELSEHLPVLRHQPTDLKISSLEQYQFGHSEEWERWYREIPSIQLGDYAITPMPPITGATARFHVNGLSIYLDCYSRLGAVPEPYWEVYPVDGDCARFVMEDTKSLARCINEHGRLH